MRDFFSPSVIFFLLLQAIAVALAVNPLTREQLLLFGENPKLYITQFLDERESTRDVLSEHLPTFFPPAFACEFLDGTTKKTIFSGEVVHAKELAEIHCSKGMIIYMQPGSSLQLRRAPENSKGIRLDLGTILVEAGQREYFFLHTNWGNLEFRGVKIGKFSHFTKDEPPYGASILRGAGSVHIHFNSASRSYFLPQIFLVNNVDVFSVSINNGTEINLPRGIAVPVNSNEVLLQERARSLGTRPIFFLFPKEQAETLGLMGGSAEVESFDAASLKYTLQLRWQNKSDKKGIPCVVTISSDVEHTKAVQKFTSNQDFVRIALKPGAYYWSVSCSMAGGSMYSAVASLTISNIPSVEKPRNDAVLPGSGEFRWSTILSASFYELQFSRDRTFTHVSKVTSTNNFLHVALPNGEYYWRVVGFGKNNQPITNPSEPLKVIFKKE